MQTAHLFERFYTVNTARSGTGLGLSIAKLLTEKMGGNVIAEYNEGKLRIFVRFPDRGQRKGKGEKQCQREHGNTSVFWRP